MCILDTKVAYVFLSKSVPRRGIALRSETENFTSLGTLQSTIQQLRSRRKDRTQERRRLKEQLRHRDRIIARQRQEIEHLRAVVDPQKVFNCSYPAQMMALAVFVVLHGRSLRCAAATAGFYAELMGWRFSAPAFKSMSNWVERCGLYALRLTKTLSGEYVGILGPSIQISKEQLLLLLGVRAEHAASLDRPLRGADVEILGLEVQSSWNGDEVADFMRRTLAERPGLRLRYVVCDRCGNLLAALRALALPMVSDCSHVMMNLVKRIVRDDTALSKLCAQIGELRQRLLLTDYAFALPATLRDRDRFGRIFTLVPWMDCIDRYAAAGLNAELYGRLSAGRNR